jgi:hypothetical protein
MTDFSSYVFDGTSVPNQTKTLKSSSLLRATQFIDYWLDNNHALRMKAIFGNWVPIVKLDPNEFAPEWVWFHRTIQHELPTDGWGCPAMGWCDAWFENAKYYAIIVAPANFHPPPIFG